MKRSERKKEKKEKRKKEQRPKYIPPEEASITSLLAEETPLPIFYDPRTAKYYYPIVAIREEEPTLRDIITEKPKFKYDKKTKSYYDEVTGDIFLQFNTPEDFKTERKHQKDKVVTKKAETEAHRTPIYFDIDNSKYYYPQMALGDRVKVDRELIRIKKAPLRYNPKTKEFIHKMSGEVYIELTDPQQFVQYRDEVVEKLGIIDAENFADETPIYSDPENDKLFYPKTATIEKELIPRMIITEVPPLFLDPKRKRHYQVSYSDAFFKKLYQLKVGFKLLKELCQLKRGIHR